MFNGMYHSVHINDVQIQRGSPLAKHRPLVVGIDVAKNDMKAAFGRKDGTVHQVVRWEHPFETEGFMGLINHLGSAGVQLVMEPTGTYQDPLRYRAYEEKWEVYFLSPNRVHNAAEVYDGVPSQHDAKACHLLVWLHAQGMSERWEPEGPDRRRLKVLTDRMANLEEAFQRREGRLEAQMAKYWPEVATGWNLLNATMLGVLKEFGGPRTVAENRGKARRRMKQLGGHFLKETRIEQVLQWAADTVGPPMLKEERAMLSQLAEDADRIRRRQRELTRRVSRLIREDPAFEDVRRLGEEVGEATAAVFRVKVGDFRDYKAPRALFKGFGLNLKEKSSGSQKGQLRITKRGSSEARRYLYLATLRKIRRDPIFGAWHQKKIQRDGGIKLKSVIALMRKYLKGLWHVARGTRFDSRRLFDLSRLNLPERKRQRKPCVEIRR